MRIASTAPEPTGRSWALDFGLQVAPARRVTSEVPKHFPMPVGLDKPRLYLTLAVLDVLRAAVPVEPVCLTCLRGRVRAANIPRTEVVLCAWGEILL